jgi:hypothetical protein
MINNIVKIICLENKKQVLTNIFDKKFYQTNKISIFDKLFYQNEYERKIIKNTCE